VQQNDIIILLVVAKAGVVIFYALSLSLLFTLFAPRFFECREPKRVVRLSRVYALSE
jgi:hypothetical protein